MARGGGDRVGEGGMYTRCSCNCGLAPWCYVCVRVCVCACVCVCVCLCVCVCVCVAATLFESVSALCRVPRCAHTRDACARTYEHMRAA